LNISPTEWSLTYLKNAGMIFGNNNIQFNNFQPAHSGHFQYRLPQGGGSPFCAANPQNVLNASPYATGPSTCAVTPPNAAVATPYPVAPQFGFAASHNGVAYSPNAANLDNGMHQGYQMRLASPENNFVCNMNISNAGDLNIDNFNQGYQQVALLANEEAFYMPQELTHMQEELTYMPQDLINMPQNLTQMPRELVDMPEDLGAQPGYISEEEFQAFLQPMELSQEPGQIELSDLMVSQSQVELIMASHVQ
jgi:hypothetical protein